MRMSYLISPTYVSCIVRFVRTRRRRKTVILFVRLLRAMKILPPLCKVNCEADAVNDSLEPLAVFSYFKYTTVTHSGVKSSLWIILLLAVISNVGVIIHRGRWRGKRGGKDRQMTSLSILLINLAASDLFIAIGKILFLAAVQTTNSWCEEATEGTKRLCFGAFLFSTVACSMTMLMVVTVAALFFKELVGCCKQPRNTSRLTIGVIVLVDWILSIVYFVFHRAFSFSEDVTLPGGTKINNWHNCWAYDTAADSALHRIRDLVSISFILFGCFMVGLLFLASLASVYYKNIKWTSQFRSRIGFTLISVTVTSLVLGILQTSWSLYFVIHSSEVKDLIHHPRIQRTAIAVSFFTPFLSLLNPLLFTVFTTSCWTAVKAQFCPRKVFEFTNSNSEPRRVDETTNLFPELSDPCTSFDVESD
eukprot:m.199858 g.199858  ORF g.199858 m.199858 type:complete len:419 (+) comp39580_c0_seq4:590-1846(+)